MSRSLADCEKNLDSISGSQRIYLLYKTSRRSPGLAQFVVQCLPSVLSQRFHWMGREKLITHSHLLTGFRNIQIELSYNVTGGIFCVVINGLLL